jgi:hypothetical protein
MLARCCAPFTAYCTLNRKQRHKLPLYLGRYSKFRLTVSDPSRTQALQGALIALRQLDPPTLRRRARE